VAISLKNGKGGAEFGNQLHYSNPPTQERGSVASITQGLAPRRACHAVDHHQRRVQNRDREEGPAYKLGCGNGACCPTAEAKGKWLLWNGLAILKYKLRRLDHDNKQIQKWSVAVRHPWARRSLELYAIHGLPS